jgi:hypothetical protein
MHDAPEYGLALPEESSLLLPTESARHEVLAGALLLVVGVDFSTLSEAEHGELGIKKIYEMASYENYHRYLKVSQFIGEILDGVKRDWQNAREVKSRKFKGPLGSLVHYLTSLNSDNEIVLQERVLTAARVEAEDSLGELAA